MTAAPGIDDVDAGPGQRRPARRDGLADTVRCGDGADRVEADALDDVALDCETVTRTLTTPSRRRPQTATDKTRRRSTPAPSTVQRLGRRGVVRVVATSSERGTVGASGFVDVAGLSLPLASHASGSPSPAAAPN